MYERAIMKAGRRMAQLFILELLVYGVFLALYLYLILAVLDGPLAAFQANHRTAYAFLALGLIVLQGVALEIVTTQLIRQFSGRDR